MILNGTTPRRVSVAGKMAILAFAALLLPLALTGAQPETEGNETSTEASPAHDEGALDVLTKRADDARHENSGSIPSGFLSDKDEDENENENENETKTKSMKITSKSKR